MFRNIFLFVTIAVLFAACSLDFTPKPRGYFRIDLPEKEYLHYHSADCPYFFDYPKYGKINVYNADSFWVNLDFARFNAKIHITYLRIEDDSLGHFEETRELVYKHSIKADDINETEFFNEEKKIYGILYDIKGNVASPVNFFVSDSVKHFFRGALYFNTAPNKDSLSPVIKFLREDIVKLMETMEWNPNF